jgi:NCS1 family nucleobase:cation symporter-1
VGIVVQIPFVATDLYTGPCARALGGVDLSWIVGIAVVSPVYYFAVRSFQQPLSAAPAEKISEEY